VAIAALPPRQHCLARGPASRAATKQRAVPAELRGVSVPLRWGAQLAAPRPAQRTTLTATLEPSATNGSVSGPGVVGPPPRAVLGRTVSPCRRRRLVAFRIGDDRSLLRTTPSDRRFRPPIPAHARRRTACIAPARGRDRAGGRGAPVQERPVETQPQALSEVHTTFSRVCHIRVVPTTATRLYQVRSEYWGRHLTLFPLQS